MDPRGFPTSLPEFQAVFPTDAACAAYLEKMRWPDGFTCHKCSTQGESRWLAMNPLIVSLSFCAVAKSFSPALP